MWAPLQPVSMSIKPRAPAELTQLGIETSLCTAPPSIQTRNGARDVIADDVTWGNQNIDGEKEIITIKTNIVQFCLTGENE